MKDKVELHKIKLKTKHMYGFGFCNIAWAETNIPGKYKLIIYYSPNNDEWADVNLNGEYPELGKLGRFCTEPNEEKKGLSIDKADPFWEDLDLRKNVYKIVISGRRKIAKIIDKICRDTNYNGKENEQAKEELMEFRQSLPAKEYKKPIKYKTLDNYQGSLVRMPEIYATHTVMRLLNKRGNFEVYKQDNNGRKIIDLEVFSSICVNILVNESPKIRAVYDDTGERKAILSSEIINFKSLLDLIDEKSEPKVENLVNGGLGRCLAVNYVLENDDGHEGNYGYVDGKIYIIDFDRTTWPLAAKYIGFFSKAKVDVFPITTLDIDNFPLLQDANPSRFLDATANSSCSADSPRLSAFKNNRQLRDDAYFIFLKRLLLDEKVFRAIANEVFTSQSFIEKVVRHEVERTAALQKALLASKKFLGFMRTTPNLKARLMKEFADYNEHFCKKSDSRLRIDIAGIADNWETINKLFQKQVRTYCILH